MAQFVTNAIVLRRADYRDNDRMLTLFSPTLGRIDALCRGCRRQKSPLLAAGELFCTGEYALYQTGERCTVVSCQVTETYYPLRADYERLSHGMYALELCAAAVQPGQENERLFLLLLRSLAHLCYGTSEPRRVTAVFLMGLTSLLGFRPQVGRCVRCGRPVLDGSGAGLCPDPHPNGLASVASSASVASASGATAGQAANPFGGGGSTAAVAAFSPQMGGVLCGECAAGEHVRLTARDVRYLHGIMRKGLDSLEDEGECPDELFSALRALAEQRLELPIRSSKLLI